MTLYHYYHVSAWKRAEAVKTAEVKLAGIAADNLDNYVEVPPPSSFSMSMATSLSDIKLYLGI